MLISSPPISFVQVIFFFCCITFVFQQKPTICTRSRHYRHMRKGKKWDLKCVAAQFTIFEKIQVVFALAIKVSGKFFVICDSKIKDGLGTSSSSNLIHEREGFLNKSIGDSVQDSESGLIELRSDSCERCAYTHYLPFHHHTSLLFDGSAEFLLPQCIFFSPSFVANLLI